jgi:hypothetical protein
MSSIGSDDGKPAAQSELENTKSPPPVSPQAPPTEKPSGAQQFKIYHSAPSSKVLNAAATSTWSVERLADNLETLGNALSAKKNANNTKKLTPEESTEIRTNLAARAPPSVLFVEDKQTKQSDGKQSSSFIQNAPADSSTKNIPVQQTTHATLPNGHLQATLPLPIPKKHGNAKKRRITKDDVINAYNAGIGALNPSAQLLESLIRRHEQRMLQKLDDDSEQQQDRKRKTTEKRATEQKDASISNKNDQASKKDNSASGQTLAIQMPALMPPNPLFTTVALPVNPQTVAFPFPQGNPLFPPFINTNLFSFLGQAPGLPSVGAQTTSQPLKRKSSKQPIDVVDLTDDDPTDGPEKPTTKLPGAIEPINAPPDLKQARKAMLRAEKEQVAATVRNKVTEPKPDVARKKAPMAAPKSTKAKTSRPKSSPSNEFSPEIGVIPRRPGYASRTLVQLQDATKKWYERNIASKENKAAPTKIFTLYFNELSVAAVSRWASGGPVQKKQKSSSKLQSESTPSTLKRPTVDTRYRMCGICSLYGHYEIECPKLSKTHISQFGNALRPHAMGKDSNVFGLEDDKLYDVVTEVCEGFIVEQRSPANSSLMNETSNGHASQTIIKTELEGFVIEAGRTEESFSLSKKKGSTTITPAKATCITYVTKEKTLEVGDLVAWYLTASTPESDPQCQDVCIGVIKDFEEDVALIRVLKSIPFDDKKEIQEDGTKCPAPDSLCWVRKTYLYLV